MDTNTNLLIEVSKKKLRFPMTNGHIATEDLWDLSLKALDELAVRIDAETTSRGRKSFRSNPDVTVTKEQADNDLRLEVLKAFIERKEADNAAKASAANLKARLAFLEDAREKKQLNALESLSLEDIDKEIAALKNG